MTMRPEWRASRPKAARYPSMKQSYLEEELQAIVPLLSDPEKANEFRIAVPSL